MATPKMKPKAKSVGKAMQLKSAMPGKKAPLSPKTQKKIKTGIEGFAPIIGKNGKRFMPLTGKEY